MKMREVADGRVTLLLAPDDCQMLAVACERARPHAITDDELHLFEGLTLLFQVLARLADDAPSPTRRKEARR